MTAAALRANSYGSPAALEDLQTFSKTFGLPEPDLTVIHIDGKPTFNGAMHGVQLDWAVETNLDLQWAHAIAPCATLVLIASNPAEIEGVHGFPSMFQGIDYAVEHYPGTVISQSFAVTEQSFHSAADEQVARFDEVYLRAVAAGCTLLAASGDWGTADTDKQGRVFPFPVVDWPASDPLVTARGGMQLQWGWRWTPQASKEQYWAVLQALGDRQAALDATGFLKSDSGPYGIEAVWNEVISPFGPNATGGGLSALFATPNFQAGLPQTLLRGRRGIPDISWNAALDGGVLIYIGDLSPFNRDGWLLGTGTSAASPQLAGVIALANQLRSQNGKGPRHAPRPRRPCPSSSAVIARLSRQMP